MRWIPPTLCLLGLPVLLLAPASAQAQEVRVTVMAIHATDKNKDVDEDLKDIAEKVQKAEPTLTGFKKGRATAQNLAKDKPATFPLVGDEVATITFEGLDGKHQDKPKVKVKPPAQGSITYTIVYDKFFPIVTRYETANKERLIVAIMIEPVKK